MEEINRTLISLLNGAACCPLERELKQQNYAVRTEKCVLNSVIARVFKSEGLFQSNAHHSFLSGDLAAVLIIGVSEIVRRLQDES